MKTTIKPLFLVLFILILFNCDNDDNTAPNVNVCNYQGLTALIGSTQTLIPEVNLTTDYFPNNDGPGQAAVEVYDNTNPGDTFVVTRALTVGAVDNSPEITINNTSYTGTVTCQRAGSTVGSELRFDIVLSSGEEAELCVSIDSVTP